MQILEKLTYDPNDTSRSVPEHTDKIILPAKILEELMDFMKYDPLPKLPHPLVFKLSTPSNSTYVGVKEFHDLNIDNLYLSQDVIKRLNIGDIENSLLLSLELALNVSDFGDKTDNKARVEIAPRETYLHVSDWKKFLESTLSTSYTAISTNDILTFDIDGHDYILDVKSVKTTNNLKTVCVVDRDIGLVVKLPHGKKDKQKGGGDDEISDLFKDKSGILKAKQKFKLILEPDEIFRCDGEFLISFDKFVGLNRFEFGSIISPKKEWINKTDYETEIFIYVLGKETDGGIKDVTFNVSKVEKDELKKDDDNNGNNEEVDENSIKCEYCDKIISKSSLVLHESFCKRNNIKCSQCNEVFFKKIPEKHWHCCNGTLGTGDWSKYLHDTYLHGEIFNCNVCNYFHGNEYELSLHLARECPKALHECRYCHLCLIRGEPSVTSKFHEVSFHEWKCGSKTTDCSRCGRIVKISNLKAHLRLHDLNRLKQVTPIKCSNKLCLNLSNENNLKLCADCFGPLYSRAHDPDGKKLRQRIERRYILQLRNGCEFKNCQNKLCHNSSDGVLSKDTSMPEIVQYVKDDVMNKTEFSFCVNEGMNFRRYLVEFFKDEDWEIGWVCKSMEMTGGIVPEMKTWLEENAVRKSELS